MIGAGLIIVLAAGLVLLFFIGGAKKPKRRSGYHTHTTHKTDLNPQFVKDRWTDITAQTKTPNGAKNALIDADKLLDYVLKGRGYRGETMAERLKKAQSSLSNSQAVWSAHKLRNAVVHDVGHDIVVVQVQRAVEDLGQAINDLGVML